LTGQRFSRYAEPAVHFVHSSGSGLPTKKNAPPNGEAFFLVAGAGLEPATSWL
jgi:hypothetical protein